MLSPLIQLIINMFEDISIALVVPDCSFTDNCMTTGMTDTDDVVFAFLASTTVVVISNL